MNLTPEELKSAVEFSKEKQRQNRLNGLKVPINIKCVVCETAITSTLGCDNNRSDLAIEYADHSSFDNGAVGTIAFGYGCKHDGDVLIIGICKDCYVMKLATKGVLFTHSYIP